MLKQVLNKILVMLCTPFLSFRNKMNSSWDICLILFFFHHDSLFIFLPLTICSSLSSIYRRETAAWSSNSKSWMLACPKCIIYAKTLEVSYNFFIFIYLFFSDQRTTRVEFIFQHAGCSLPHPVKQLNTCFSVFPFDLPLTEDSMKG